MSRSVLCLGGIVRVKECAKISFSFSTKVTVFEALSGY